MTALVSVDSSRVSVAAPRRAIRGGRSAGVTALVSVRPIRASVAACRRGRGAIRDGVAGARRAPSLRVAMLGSLVAVTMIAGGAGAAGADPGAREETRQVLGKEPGEGDRSADEIARLIGQRVVVDPGGSYRIADVAGEGAPEVGVVERRGDGLWLRAAGGERRLAGPLAHPRIAGPGYKVWVLGRIGPDGALVARRIGILARPAPDTRRAAAPRPLADPRAGAPLADPRAGAPLAAGGR